MVGTEDRSPSFRLEVPEGDERERSVCQRCGFIDYQNPKIVCGAVATDDQDRVLLCKRAIEPQRGFWTLPAGYLELGESAEAGAKREAMEEAGATLTIERLLAIYSVVRAGQMQLIYRARLDNPKGLKAGIETQELRLFAYADIPWDSLAFPSVVWALRDWHRTKGQTGFDPCTNPIGGL